MEGIIIESVIEVVAVLLMTLIGVLGTWLTMKVGKRAELTAINAAQQEVIRLAQITVGELQQTLVEGLKAGREDGKLTKEEINMLGEKLLDGVIAKMSAPTAKLLESAAVDVTALIQSAGENWIAKLKAGEAKTE
ncbi:MAG: hypothetical protein ACI4QW_03545 [Clostridia bacterium]